VQIVSDLGPILGAFLKRYPEIQLERPARAPRARGTRTPAAGRSPRGAAPRCRGDAVKRVGGQGALARGCPALFGKVGIMLAAPRPPRECGEAPQPQFPSGDAALAWNGTERNAKEPSVDAGAARRAHAVGLEVGPRVKWRGDEAGKAQRNLRSALKRPSETL
jgi:hypothetical protein